MSIELKQAAQQAVDAFHAFGDADDFASLFELTQKMRALRTAIQQVEAQQPATGEPDEWKLVPIVPTEKMLLAYTGGAVTNAGFRWCRHQWSAMLAAAPAAHPAPSVPGDVFDLICNAIDKADTITMEGDYMLDSDDCIAVVRVMQVLLSVRAAMLAAKKETP